MSDIKLQTQKRTQRVNDIQILIQQLEALDSEIETQCNSWQVTINDLIKSLKKLQ